MLTQDIPDAGNILQASNSFIIDQGVTMFVVVVFAAVIFGMLIIMFMMLRQMGRESKQQDRQIMQHGLTIGKMGNFEIAINKLADIQTTSTAGTQQIISEQTATVAGHTKAIVGLKKIIDEVARIIKEAPETIARAIQEQQASVNSNQTNLLVQLSQQMETLQQEFAIVSAKIITQETPIATSDDNEQPKTKETKPL